VLRDGRIGLHMDIALARPRRHADPNFAVLRSDLLSALGIAPDVAA
jgi:hypothetical protein